MKNRYENPLITRYAGQDMSYIFSDDKKFKTWRKLWIALAEAEKELGLNISDKQINELKSNKDNINYEVAEAREKEVRHDVMAHVYAYGEQCPNAKGIIHLGATSCYVGDNTDIILMNEALQVVEKKLIATIKVLADFADRYSELPTLGFTHFQPAQLTTVGKRATLWLQDLLMDYEQLIWVLSQIKLRGLKGTTGTQASFLELFDGDENKVFELEQRVIQKLGYNKSYPVTGQTYPRKFDSLVMHLLNSIAQSAYKFSNDIRLLQNLNEIEEPFENDQIGSSAMAYKRNPMRSERIGSLCRFVISLTSSPDITASTQWFERTLDDSANKRLVIPQAFLAIDAILNLYKNIASGLIVYEKVIENHIKEKLPFMATEAILMRAVKNGGDRQDLHEKIREYSMRASERVKSLGLDNNLLELIAEDQNFPITHEELNSMLDPTRFTGLASVQTTNFIREYIKPVLELYNNQIIETDEINI